MQETIDRAAQTGKDVDFEDRLLMPDGSVRHVHVVARAWIDRRMVNGYVRPPAIALANRDLIEAHLHAVWLAETGKELSPDIPHVLHLSAASLPVQEETEFGITLAAPP